MFNIRTILHPTDFSPGADSAWQLACALAHDYKSRLILLHVETPPEVIMGEFGMLPPDLPDREQLQDQLRSIEPTHEKLDVTRFFAAGPAADEILRIAEENGCDLIVMGTHGRSGMERLVMGSTAEEVVRKAACPVLTVKTPLVEIDEEMPAEMQSVTP
jgi:nucleotide-binding universal stress UspA family protein